MKPGNRLTCAAVVAAALSTGCDHQEPPLAPSADVESVMRGASVPTTANHAARAAIQDALDRVIPSFGSDSRAKALHDAFDLVADALEDRERKLDRRLADARTVVASVQSKAPPHWLPELDALRLALGDGRHVPLKD